MRAFKQHILVAAAMASILAVSTQAQAAEICGNGIDEDADGYADSGCGFANWVMGVCESPMSCAETGDIDPVTGAWVYQLPADIAPTVPFGPKFEFRRTYMSKYAPPATNYRTAMGNRWQHNFMSWLDKSGTSVVVHLPSGQDVKFTYTSTPGDGYDYYNAAQPGAHFKHLRQLTSGANTWELKTLTGEVYKFDWSSPVGKLIEIHDSLATPNKITIAYLPNGQTKGQIDTVTDASGKKRFKFTYSSGLATSVAYQTGSVSTWTTRVTLALSYTSSNPTTVQIGGTTIQTNNYASNYLTSIVDGNSKTLVSTNYVAATPGKLANVTTMNGSIGYDFASAHAQCTGKTALFFNLANATATCSDDSGCGSGERCGGKTGAGSTGRCYRAARCLTTTSPSENLITTITAFTPCTGACAPTAQYSWNTTTLDLKGIKLADNNWTSYQRDANGMVITMSEGDVDDIAEDADPVPHTWFFYGDANFPGRVTEVRGQTDTSAGTSCSDSVTTHCKRTLFTWNSNGQLGSKEERGFTGQHLNATPYTYTTTYTYGAGNGRLSQIDGPLSGAHDVVEYTYWTSADVLKDGYVNLIKRKKNTSEYLITTRDGYDYFGNAGSTQDPDSTFTCRTWDGNRNYLSQVREAMNGQVSCITAHSSDLVTAYLQDSSKRVTTTTNPNGNCELYEYGPFGRLSGIKLRDDCNPTSSGDGSTISYSPNGQLELAEVSDPAGAVRSRSKSTFFSGLQLATQENPISPTYARTYAYFGDGTLESVTFENAVGKVASLRDAQNRETTHRRFLDTSNSLSWTLGYPASNATSTRMYEKVTDPTGGKDVFTYLDDLGRRTTNISPDSGTTVHAYDAASRRVSTIEAKDTVEQVTHTFQFDNLGRKLVEDYGSETCGGNPIDVEYNYDSLPVGVNCPSGAVCTRTAGRLARVKTFLLCAGATGIFQETFYGYDDAGRLVSEFSSDNSPRTALQTYAWDKNGNMTAAKAPTNASMSYAFGGAGNSDANLVTALARTVGGTPTNLATGITWAPFGPVTQYDQENTIGGNKLRATLTWNLAYRASQIKFATTGVNKTTIDYTEDEKGRYTQKVYSNVHSNVLNDYFRYDWLDRITCESTFAVSECPPSGTVTSVNYNTSNDRTSFRHSDPIFGNQIYTNSYTSGTDKISGIASTSVGTTSLVWNLRGDRTFEDNPTSSVDSRSYTYDGKRRVRTITGYFRSGSTCNPVCVPAYKQYRITYAFDQLDRLVFRSFANLTSGGESNTFYYYDVNNRLIEIKLVPLISDQSTYTIYDFYWLGQRPVAMWALAFPAATTARYFLHADEQNRVLEVYTWPTSGDAALAWALDPNAFGWENVVTGTLFQPLRMTNMLVDEGTLAWSNADSVAPAAARPAILVSSDASLYDPMTGTTLQRASQWPVEPYGPMTEGLGGTPQWSRQTARRSECGTPCPDCWPSPTREPQVIAHQAPTGVGQGSTTERGCFRDCSTYCLVAAVCFAACEKQTASGKARAFRTCTKDSPTWTLGRGRIVQSISCSVMDSIWCEAGQETSPPPPPP